MSRGTGHEITSASQKDGSTWHDSQGREWQRWWCGKDHGTGRRCSVSIPSLTGKKK